MKGYFPLKWYILLGELYLQPFLIARFVQARPQFLVNCVKSTYNIINVIF